MTNAKTTGMTALMVGTLLLGALLAFAPSASAQTVPPPTFKFTITGQSGGAVIPLEEKETLTLAYTYTLSGTQIQGSASSAQGSSLVTFTINCNPNEVVITGQKTDLITIPPGSTETEYTGSPVIEITPNRVAPGLEPITCDITGSAAAIGNAVPASNSFTNTVQITPDFFSLVEVTAPTKLRQGGPQKEVAYTIQVANFGNSPTRVKFEFAEGGTPGSKWQGFLPDQLLLDPVGGNKASGDAIFTVTTPHKNGWNNDQGQFILSVKPEYALNPDKKGSDIQVTIATRVRGVYVPSLEPVVMLGAVLGSALVARQLRQEDEE